MTVLACYGGIIMAGVGNRYRNRDRDRDRFLPKQTTASISIAMLLSGRWNLPRRHFGLDAGTTDNVYALFRHA